MADLTSSDVSVSFSNRNKDIVRGTGIKFLGVANVQFGDGALTYPTGGVPLPSIGNFGLLRQVDFGKIEDPPGDGYVYKFDRANHKIRIYQQKDPADAGGADIPLVEVGASFAPAATSFSMFIVGE